jgi:hypothetical protein
MANAKSIIEVEIKDGAWKRFQRQVESHRKNLAEMPHQWGAIGKAMRKTADEGARIIARIKEQVRVLKETKTISGKITLALKGVDRTLTSIGRKTSNWARHLKDVTKSILSWVPVFGIISGLMGAGGLFGLSRLAASVTQGSITAAGAGSTYGGAKAAGISYAPALGGEGAVTSLLNRVAEEQRSGGVMFRRLGMSEAQWKGKGSSDVLGPLLQAIQRKYKEGPEATAKLRMEAFAPGIDFATIMRTAKMNIGAMQREYEARKHLLDLSQGTQDSWMRFHRALETAGERLQNIFARALGGKLLSAIERFTNGLLRAASILMNSPLIRNMIAGAGKSLETGAKYLTSQEFQTDFKGFLTNMSDIVDALSVIADSLITITGTRGRGFQEKLAKESEDIRRYWERKEFERNATKTIQAQHPAWTPSQVHAKVEILLQNAPGSNTIGQAKGISSATYRR